MTPVGVLYFPALFEPKVNKENPTQGARYSCVLLFDSNGVASSAYMALRQAVKEAIAEKFGDVKAADQQFLRGLRSPFRPASEKTYDGFANGEVFVSAWSRGSDPAPGVVDLKGHRILTPGDVFGGQYARATIRPFAYENSGNKGVAFGLEHVQIVKADMPRLDGRRSAEDTFKGSGSDEDLNKQLAAMGVDASLSAGSAGGGDDDLPF